MNAKPLPLNRNEVMLLADRTLNTDAGTPDHQVIAYRLLVKLGILYLELVTTTGSSDAECNITVTEAEAWLLRSKVQSGDKIGSDPLFGVKLLRKLYRLLIDFDADTDSLPISESDGEHMDREHRENLTLWRQLEQKEGSDDEKQPA